MNIAPKKPQNQKICHDFWVVHVSAIQGKTTMAKLKLFRSLTWMQCKAIVKRAVLLYERTAARALQLLTQSMRHKQTVKQMALPIAGGVR